MEHNNDYIGNANMKHNIFPICKETDIRVSDLHQHSPEDRISRTTAPKLTCITHADSQNILNSTLMP